MDAPKHETIASGMTPELAAALVKAQAEMRNIQNSARAGKGGFGYNYTPGHAIRCHARPVLAANGLSIAVLDQRIQRVDGVAVPVARVTVMLSHESGGHILSEVEMPVIEGKGRPLDKAMGAGVTNATRYAMAGILNIGWSDESDDVDARDEAEQNRTDANTPVNIVRGLYSSMGEGPFGELCQVTIGRIPSKGARLSGIECNQIIAAARENGHLAQ